MKAGSKRLLVMSALIVMLAGCRSELKVTNRSDPKAFEPVDIPGYGATGEVFAELEFEVPEEISDEDFEITRADIFGVVSLDSIEVEGGFEIVVDLYLSTEPGAAGIGDTSVNEYLATVTITDLAPMTQVAIEDPVLLAPGLGNGVFYVKIFASVNENPTTPQDPLLGVLTIRDIYFIAWLERETEGLFPAFYVF